MHLDLSQRLLRRQSHDPRYHKNFLFDVSAISPSSGDSFNYMNPIVDSSLNLISSLMEMASTHQRRKYKKDFHSLLRRVRSEERKPYHKRDDALIDDTYNELSDLLRSFKSEIDAT